MIPRWILRTEYRRFPDGGCYAVILNRWSWLYAGKALAPWNQPRDVRPTAHKIAEWLMKAERRGWIAFDHPDITPSV